MTNKPLTFNQWLSQECCMNESQLTKEYVMSLGYTEEDVEDYIESKHHDYSIYLRKFNK